MRKRKFKKIIVAIFIALFTISIFSNVVYAGGETLIDDALDGIVGILCYPMRLIPILIGAVCSLLANAIGNKGLGFLNLDQILFTASGWDTSGTGKTGKDFVPVVSIDFFGLSSDSYWNNDSIFKSIRDSVQLWYVGVRNLAAVILIIIAFYVGIRMAISTVAEERAKYKSMLYDWLKSLGLLFAMHFIMIFIIFINDALVRAIGASLVSNSMNSDMGDVTNDFIEESLLTVSFINGMANAFIYAGLCILTFTYLLTYIKRMITIAFLIIISPLVTVTYSIDKMGDNKSQALNEWFKEFIYNILIQPFHCVIYRALVVLAIELLRNNKASTGGDVSLAAGIIAIMIIGFMSQAEKIIKHIFHFGAKHMADPVAEAAILGTAMKTATSSGNTKNKYADDGADKTGGGGGGGTPPPPPEPPPGTPSGKDRRRGTVPQNSNDAQRRGRSKVGKKLDRRTSSEVDKTTTRIKKAHDRFRGTVPGKIVGGVGSVQTWMLKKGLKAATVATIGTMAYMATGSTKTAIAAGTVANGVQKKALVRADEQTITQNQRELAKAYHDYQDTHPGITEAATRAEANRLAGLTDAQAAAEGLTNEQENLRNQMIKLRANYKGKAGIKDRHDLDRAMTKSLDGIQTGDIGEYSNSERYFVKARNKLTGRPNIK